MSQRYFSSEPMDGDSLVLTGAEARHLARVMRAAAGDQVVVFDGSGEECAAEVETVERDRVRLRVLRREQPARELRGELVLASAVPKGERFRWLVEKAAELGVSRLVPLVTARSVVQPREMKLQRMRAVVIEASKQSGRTRLMALDRPVRFEEFVRSETDSTAQGREPRVRGRETQRGSTLGAQPSTLDPQPYRTVRLLGDAGGPPIRSLQLDPNVPRVLAAVGPEGGFTREELELARSAGWQVVSLAATTLRVETAAVALATWAAGWFQG